MAESLVRLGTIGHLEGGDLEQTAKQLEEAYAWAERGHDDRQRLAAARELTATQLRLGTIPVAAMWGRLAEALVSRLGSPAEEATTVMTHAGWIQFNSGRREEAAAAFRRAIEWSQKMSPPDPRQAAAAESALCLSLGRRHGSDESIACMRKALAAAIDAFGPEHPALARYYGNLAYEMLEQREHLEEACALLRRSIDAAERALDPTHPTLTSAALNLGTCLGRLGRHVEARRVLEQALVTGAVPIGRIEIRFDYGNLLTSHFDVEEGIRELRTAGKEALAVEGPGSENEIRAHRLVAGALRDLGRTAEALEEIDTAIEIARKAKLQSAMTVDLHGYRAKALLAHGRYQAAIREARRAIELLVARGDEGIDLAVPLSAEGEALLKLGRVDEAVATLERGLAPFASAREFQNPVVHADLKAGLARALMRKGGQRERACTLGQDAATFYRPRVGKRLLHQELTRWLSDHHCSPQA